MSNVRIKVTSKIANIVEQRDFQIKQAKAEQLLNGLGLNKRAVASADAGNILKAIADFAYANPGLSIGTGVGTLAGGLKLYDKEDRKAVDYLTHLGGGAVIGGGVGAIIDLLRKIKPKKDSIPEEAAEKYVPEEYRDVYQNTGTLPYMPIEDKLRARNKHNNFKDKKDLKVAQMIQPGATMEDVHRLREEQGAAPGRLALPEGYKLPSLDPLWGIKKRQ